MAQLYLLTETSYSYVETKSLESQIIDLYEKFSRGLEDSKIDVDVDWGDLSKESITDL